MNRKKLVLLAIGITLITVLFYASLMILYLSRSPLLSPQTGASTPSITTPQATPYGMPRESLASTASKTGTQTLQLSQLESQRNITYVATMSVSVDDVKEAVENAKNVAEQLGGYIASIDFSLDSAQKATVTLKVPASRYREAIDKISALGKLDRLQENAIDVTDQWVDLKARLNNLRAEEARLLQLLEKATSISDVLQIEDRLASIRYQIEFYEAQLRNLERTITYATITVNFTSKHKTIEWPSIDLASTLRDGIATALAVLSFLIIAIIGLTPIIVIGGIGWITYKQILKRRKLSHLEQKST